ncbi:hypothetical protein KUTeg_001526 [Tegillarca granosa]|uniref:Major facilitator superfamily (MFS) profile domain-containing protein n=1 Tax=Tegillarca granosa TaxID=220873 RepID=A0ABQ9FRN8_TEGGR|nr:hypothetical protein KUTeg_001526 [Tegillarca granosa]
MEKEPLIDSRYGDESSSSQKQYYSDDEEIDAIVSDSSGQGLTCNLIFAIASCILGSVIYVIKKFYNESRYERYGEIFSDSAITLLWSVTLSIYCAGGMIGGLSAGYLADKFGRKGIMLRNSLLTIIAAALFYFSKFTKSYEMLIVGRFIAGIAAALKWLRGNLDVSDEIEEMKTEIEILQREEEFKFTDLFKKKELISPLIISVMMQLSQQFSGINAVIYYSTNIFRRANLTEQNAQYATLGTSAVNVVMTFISAIVMDRAGRRTLHLFGLGGLFIFSLILSISQILQPQFSWLTWVCIAAVVLYIIFFACGPGSIPWFIVAELFSQSSRPAAMSLAVLVNWTANFTVGLVFPELQKSIGNYSFIPFVVMLALFWLFTYWKVPETKGKTIEQITAMFVQETDSPSVAYSRLINEK